MSDKKGSTSVKKKFINSSAPGAAKALLEELFQDMYQHRYNLYKMNFIRGLMFGAGSILGGIIALALLIWILSLFNEVPLVGGFVDSLRQSVDEQR